MPASFEAIEMRLESGRSAWFTCDDLSSPVRFCVGWDRGTPPRVFDRDRKGERCRVIARGGMNSTLIEFQDGYRTVTRQSGIRNVGGGPT